MSEPQARYGRRLTRVEYDQRVVRLHDQALAEVGAESKEALNRRVRELESDLEIDRQLGVDFPEAQREAVRRVRERVAAEQGRMSVKLLLRRITGRGYAQEMQNLVERAVAELSEDVDPRDVMKLLGIDDTKTAALPIDPNRIEDGFRED